MKIAGIEIIKSKDKNEASDQALLEILKIIDQDVLLLLSGGTSPSVLYKLIVENRKLTPGAVVLIDERYGDMMHDKSNEKMIFDTGLISYFKSLGIPFYGILKKDEMEDLADQYSETIQALFNKFSKRVAVMGIGEDGHTAGIKPNLDYDHSKLVVSYNSSDNFGKRITLTFEALSEIDNFFVLVFGLEKKESMKKIFESSDKKALPAVFFRERADKVTIFTDFDLEF